MLDNGGVNFTYLWHTYDLADLSAYIYKNAFISTFPFSKP